MSFSYTVSVILVALAMIGVWVILRDSWLYFVEPGIMHPPSVSLMIAVKDIEDHAEEMVYYLAAKVEQASVPVDIVVIDCGSIDMTPKIFERVAATYSYFTVVKTSGPQPYVEYLPVCRGAVIYLFDVVGRMHIHEFYAALYTVTRHI